VDFRGEETTRILRRITSVWDTSEEEVDFRGEETTRILRFRQVQITGWAVEYSGYEGQSYEQGEEGKERDKGGPSLVLSYCTAQTTVRKFLENSPQIRETK